jgi:uncharacterized protein YjlB
MLAHMQASASITAYLLAPDGPIPNHPRWPLLLYNGAVALSGSDPAAIFEALFTRNRWPAAWRNGVHPFHHYHADGHEALGVYSGEVTVMFGGDAGIVLTARPGDVLVLPAGTGHKKLGSKGSLGVVGAYPEGSRPSTSRKGFSEKILTAVTAVPLPACDPVFGPGGPLFEHWKP